MITLQIALKAAERLLNLSAALPHSQCPILFELCCGIIQISAPIAAPHLLGSARKPRGGVAVAPSLVGVNHECGELRSSICSLV